MPSSSFSPAQLTPGPNGPRPVPSRAASWGAIRAFVGQQIPDRLTRPHFEGGIPHERSLIDRGGGGLTASRRLGGLTILCRHVVRSRIMPAREWVVVDRSLSKPSPGHPSTAHASPLILATRN